VRQQRSRGRRRSCGNARWPRERFRRNAAIHAEPTDALAQRHDDALLRLAERGLGGDRFAAATSSA
jgi:hypothetical protein